MPRGLTKRRPETRARLLDAALDTFAETGFQAATIEQICERAGFTRGAFYSNFATKDELFYALFERNAARVVERMESVAAQVDGDLPWSRQVAELTSSVGPDDRRWFLISTEFTLHAIRNPAAAVVLADHDAKLRAAIVPILRDMYDRAGLAPAVELDHIARLLIALREGGMAQSYVEPAEFPAGQLERIFGAAVMRSVAEPRP